MPSYIVSSMSYVGTAHPSSAGTVTARSVVAELRHIGGTVTAQSATDAESWSLRWPDVVDSIGAGIAPLRQVFITLKMDLGSGLATIPNAMIGNDITVTESLDNIADELQFSLVGRQFSPLQNLALTGKRRVVLSLSYGGPGAVLTAPVFEGVLWGADFDGYSCKCVVHDAASKYIEQRVAIDIPPNSGRSRLSIARDQLDTHAVPVSLVELDPADGGTVSKAVSFTDVRLFDFVHDFLSPVDAVMWFERGMLRVSSIAKLMAQTPVAIGRNMIARPIGITAPPTSNFNTVIAAAVKFSSTEPSGTRTVVSVVTTQGVYSAMIGVYHGSPGDGSYDGSTDPTRIISRVTTTDTYFGDVIIDSLVDEEGWYAPQAARLQINVPDGSISAATGQWYAYPDGSFRYDWMESFRLVRRTRTRRYLYSGSYAESAQSDGTQVSLMFGFPQLHNYIVRETVTSGFYHFIRQAIYEVVGGVETIQQTTPITESGEGVWAGVEVFGAWDTYGDSQKITEWVYLLRVVPAYVLDGGTYTWLPDGSLFSERVTNTGYSMGSDRAPSQDGSWVYGTNSRTYKSLPLETERASWTIQTTRYAAIGEDSYSIMAATTVTEGGTPISGASRVTASTATGALPYGQKVGNENSSQEISSRVEYALGRAMNGEILDPIHNEFIETVAEAHTVALAEIRDQAAIPVTINMPLEGTLHKGMVITPALPEYGANVPMLVWTVVRNFGTFRQVVTARKFAEGTV